MAAQRIFDVCRDHSNIIDMSVKIKPPISTPQQVQAQNSSSLVKEIKLEFKVQLECDYLQQVVQEGSSDVTTSLIGQISITPSLPFVTHQLPVCFFNHDEKLLSRYLSRQLETYQDIINIEFVAEEIIKYWDNHVKQEGNLSAFGEIYPLEIIIQYIIKFETMYAEQESSLMIESGFVDVDVDADGMLPTSENAIEKMLEKVEIKEMEVGDDQNNCVICLEENTKREEEKIVLMKMPCLHVFHEDCIKKWLKTSHYCPTCRFPMPVE